MTHHELHPLCTLFPRLAGAEFDSLVADIKANGLRQPIVLLDGMILDGGNRYRACIEAGVKPTFTKFSGGNIVSFVLSANMHRRHLSAGQQAAIVASAQDWATAQTVGKPKSVNVDPLATIEQRAAQSGASRSTQKMADKVAKADPVLAKQVAHGEVSLPKAVAKVEGKSPIAKAKPEVDPLISLKEENDSLRQENEHLRGELREAHDTARDLAHDLESYNTATAGEIAVAKEIKRLKGMLATVEATRDQWMTTAGELRREVKSMQRKLKAAA